MSELIISAPAHMRSRHTTRRIMLDVIIALLPATVAGIVLFGIYSLALIVISVASAVLTEFVYIFIHKCGWRDAKGFVRNFMRQFDFTSIITGMLLALCLPSSAAWYYPLLGSMFAVAAVKMLFGGTGKNVFNPAVTGRVFLFLSFAGMTSAGVCLFAPIFDNVGDIATGATPLVSMLGGNGRLSVLDLFLGSGVGGTIGETCKVALIAGGIYLVLRKVIKWWPPLLYIGVTGLFGVMLDGFDFSLFLPYILSGGLILGAIFMATDYSTTPKSTPGKLVYYVLLGLITAGLRKATGIEVVSYCIMLGNIVVPLIDVYIYWRPFGYKKIKKGEVK